MTTNVSQNVFILDFIRAKDDGDDRDGGDNWTTVRHEKLPSDRQHQQTNVRQFIVRVPFVLPNQQHQSTEGNKCHVLRTCLA